MSILNMIASSLGGDWKTATATGYNAGTTTRPKYAVEFDVEREPAEFVIVRTTTSTSTVAANDEDRSIAIMVTDNMCIGVYSPSQYTMIFTDRSAYSNITKSNTKLIADFDENQSTGRGRFIGEYTLFYV